jgi:preprotein translocase subunit SecG
LHYFLFCNKFKTYYLYFALRSLIQMGILSVVLLVFFIMVSFLLVFLVLVQNEEGDSLGGIFAGGSSSAFGSRSGNVLTRATSVLGALFLIISFGLALINRTPGDSGVERAGTESRQQAGGTDRNWWKEPPPGPEGSAAETMLEASGTIETPLPLNPAPLSGPPASAPETPAAAETPETETPAPEAGE